MIKKDIAEIIDDILRMCNVAPADFMEVSHLIRLSIGDKNGTEDIYDLRFLIEAKIEEEGLLRKYPAGYAPNGKTQEIVAAGGYIQYIAHQQEKSELQDKADEARNRTAIIVWKRTNWAFALSIFAILISLVAVIVSICKSI